LADVRTLVRIWHYAPYSAALQRQEAAVRCAAGLILTPPLHPHTPGLPVRPLSLPGESGSHGVRGVNYPAQRTQESAAQTTQKALGHSSESVTCPNPLLNPMFGDCMWTTCMVHLNATDRLRRRFISRQWRTQPGGGVTRTKNVSSTTLNVSVQFCLQEDLR